MAFVLPTFNLAVDIYSGPWSGRILRLRTVGNLAFGRRVQQQFQDFAVPAAGAGSAVALLLLPALTDVRSGILTATPDLVDCPSGSGRWYGVWFVEDIGKGFDNEHRCAGLTQISSLVDPTAYPGLSWPVPMP